MRVNENSLLIVPYYLKITQKQRKKKKKNLLDTVNKLTFSSPWFRNDL